MQRNLNRSASPARQRGVTLIELMVALVLGLVVSGAALALFLTSRQTYVASENMDRIQETSRTAFELMARDIREADSNPCNSDLVPQNGLSGASTFAWWSDWGDGLLGIPGGTAFPDAGFGTAEGDRVSGTQAIEMWSAFPIGSVVTTVQATLNAPLTVTDTTGRAATGDVLVICDSGADPVTASDAQGEIFLATAVTINEIQHAAGGSSGTNGSGAFAGVVYKPNAVISKLHATRWYVGYNGGFDRDGIRTRSLYRTSLSGAAALQDPDEIVPGVTDMNLDYLYPGTSSYQATAPVWKEVTAVKVHLFLAGRDKIGTDKATLKREFENIITIRSRVP